MEHPTEDPTDDSTDDRTEAFLVAVTAFLREVVDERGEGSRADELADALDAHLGTRAADCPIVTERVAPWRIVDADAALGALDPDARVSGVSSSRGGGDDDLRRLLRSRHASTTLGPVDHVTMPVGPGQERRVVGSGLRLMTYDGAPVAVLQREADPDWGRGRATLEVIGADAGLVDRLRAEVRRRMVDESVLRGQVITFQSQGDFDESLDGIVFSERPAVPEAEVVLPDGVLERLRRHVVGMAEHREDLRAAGQHLKRGVLLHGPPGTGKTHTVRHLVGAARGATVMLLSGTSLQAVGEAARLARALEPAVVVLEDCDLIAEDRGMGGGGSMLFELLEALDGLDGDADVAFVLTTNRPDRLERALTRRPGRIDLAVEVPLPDEAARRRLFGLYSAGLGFSEDGLGEAAARAEGVTASFAKELVRRAVLVAATSGEQLDDAHLLAALDELLGDGETLTRSLLGSPDRGTEAPRSVSFLAYGGSYDRLDRPEDDVDGPWDE